jgi:hypothetical protein
MRRFDDEDLIGAEFRECDLSGARMVGVVMKDAEIDGLVTNLVVNGVEVMPYVEAELDRRHPVRLLIRSDDPADVREAWRQLRQAWATTVERARSMPAGSEERGVDGEWSMVETLRHLVFVHDSWFRRCVLGLTEPFTPMGLGPPFVMDQGQSEVDPSAQPSLDEVLAVRARHASDVEAWLAEVTPDQLAQAAPVPDDDRWPPYAKGRSVRQCLTTVLSEEFEHHGFCARDLDKLTQGGSAPPGATRSRCCSSRQRAQRCRGRHRGRQRHGSRRPNGPVLPRCRIRRPQGPRGATAARATPALSLPVSPAET